MWVFVDDFCGLALEVSFDNLSFNQGGRLVTDPSVKKVEMTPAYKWVGF